MGSRFYIFVLHSQSEDGLGADGCVHYRNSYSCLVALECSHLWALVNINAQQNGQKGKDIILAVAYIIMENTIAP